MEGHEMPGPPAGFQRPGIPGAGNILDPEVRGKIREELHPAVHRAAELARGEPKEAEESEPAAADAKPAADPKPAAPTAPAPARYRAGPFPHGDVDLSSIKANVPSGPVRPNRARGGR
ncbi:hypothetical protein HY251_08415, partial [bacterium]|nr:hypothetical protein [bacterium]